MVIAGLAALLACAAATGWAIYSQGYESTDNAQVDGHLNVVSARISGTTAAVYVTDNQMVEAGQPLVDLDPSEQQVAYAQAKAQYDQAVAQLNAQRPSVGITQADNTASVRYRRSAARAGQGRRLPASSQDLAGAKAKLAEAEALRTRDEAQLQRYEQLFKAGTISRKDYEQALAAASLFRRECHRGEGQRCIRREDGGTAQGGDRRAGRASRADYAARRRGNSRSSRRTWPPPKPTWRLPPRN